MDAEATSGIPIAMVSTKDNSDNTLRRGMGYWQSFTLIIAAIFGSGIFISPAIVCRETGSVGMTLVLWAAAGLFILLASLCYSELAICFKLSGGDYINILHIYGKLPAFLCAWVYCLVLRPAGEAVLALSIGIYITKPFYSNDNDAEAIAKIIAFVCIILVTMINSLGIKDFSRITGLFAIIQALSVMFVISIGVWKLSTGNNNNLKDAFKNYGNVKDIGIGFLITTFAFDGWQIMSQSVEEMKDVKRDILLATTTALPFISLCYILINIAFFSVLNVKQISNSEGVAVDFVIHSLGRKASYLMMVLVAVSIFGALMSAMYATSRLMLSAAREGQMPQVFALIHKTRKSPIPAIALQGVLSSILLIPSDIKVLMKLFGQASWVISGASFLGVIILRFRPSDAERTFKVFIGIHILTFSVTIFLVIMPFFEDLTSPLIFAGFLLSGVPIYAIFIHYHHVLPSCVDTFSTSLLLVMEKKCGTVICEASKS